MWVDVRLTKIKDWGEGWSLHFQQLFRKAVILLSISNLWGLQYNAALRSAITLHKQKQVQDNLKKDRKVQLPGNIANYWSQ